MGTASSSRANRLVTMRDLVALGAGCGITDRHVLVERAIEKGIFTREADNHGYSYSSIYRYFDSQRALKFDIAEEIGEPIVWSPAAIALVKAAQATMFTNELLEPEKEIFREQIFASQVSEQFLTCFSPVGEAPKSRDEFIQACQPLYVLRTMKKVSHLSPGSKHRISRDVLITLNPDSGIIVQKPEQEFMYTYRLWCLDVNLIEEINIHEAERSGIPQTVSHVIYPLRMGDLPTIDEFMDALYVAVGRRARSVVTPIPWLMYNLCVRLRISVDAFKGLLVQASAQYRELLHLERGPGILIKANSNITVKDRPYSERFGNHRYYITIGGTIRTNLVLFPGG